MFAYLAQFNQWTVVELHRLALSSPVFREIATVFGRDLDIYVIAAVMFVFLFHHHDRKIRSDQEISMTCIREMILLTFAVFSAWLTTAFLKVLIGNLRPFEIYQNFEPLFIHGGGDSFPSGHATVFAALSVMLYMIHRKGGLALALVTFLISVSRVIAGIHFPLDVVVGWLIGTFVAYFVFVLFKPRTRHRNFRSKSHD